MLSMIFMVLSASFDKLQNTAPKIIQTIRLLALNTSDKPKAIKIVAKIKGTLRSSR